MNPQSKTDRTVTYLATLGAMGVLALAAGCGQTTPEPPRKPVLVSGQHLYAGLDSSLSWRSRLGVSATLCARQTMNLDPNQDKVTLFRVDRQTEEFFDDSAPESGEELQATIIRQLQKNPTTSGTYPAVFWKEAADRAEGDSGPVTIELFSDGDNDDQEAASLADIRRSAHRLAGNPHIAGVWVFGAARENWAVLRSEFAPLGNRFHLCVPSEMTVEKVAEAVSPEP